MAVTATALLSVMTRQGIRVPGTSPSATYRAGAASSADLTSSRAASKAENDSSPPSSASGAASDSAGSATFFALPNWVASDF